MGLESEVKNLWAMASPNDKTSHCYGLLCQTKHENTDDA